MSGNNQIIPAKIHLNQIKWIKQNTILLKDMLSKNPVYDLAMGHNMMHNLEKEAVKIRLFLDINGTIDDRVINQGGNYEIDFLFTIDDLKDQYQDVNGKPIFNAVFVATLLGICFSTMRGMLFSLWQGTVLENVVIPVIAVPDLLQSKRN